MIKRIFERSLAMYLKYALRVIRRGVFFGGILITLPIAIIVILLRPWVLIRFGTLISSRIGHFAADTEAYASERRSRLNQKVVDVIACPRPVCNRQLEIMWKRTLPITPNGTGTVVALLEGSCRLLTRSVMHSVKLYNRASEYRLFVETEPSVSFTKEEECYGKQLVLKLGLPADAEWICIHNRDSKYLDATLGGRWSYHDYRDYDIESMRAAAEELTERGYYVLRVGSIVEDSLNSSNPRIIDYATSELRSDFLDIYLLSKAKFFLGGDSGIWAVPGIFRRPLAMTNFTYLAHFYETDSPWLFIPKRLRDSRTGSFLTLRETLSAGLGDATETITFSKAGVELINSSSAEIADLAIEIDDRLRGVWQVDKTAEELQGRFWSILDKHAQGLSQSGQRWGTRDKADRRARIGTEFLRRHPDFLT